MEINYNWKDGELGYCLQLVANGGNDDVGRNETSIRNYLLLQANSASTNRQHANAVVLCILARGYIG